MQSKGSITFCVHTMLACACFCLHVSVSRCAMWLWLKYMYQNVPLVNGSKDYKLRNPSPRPQDVSTCHVTAKSKPKHRCPFEKTDGPGTWNKPCLNQCLLFLTKLTQNGHLLWMDEILHHLNNPGVMLPL